MGLFRDETVVPALMFHSVGLERLDWAWSYISEPLDTFESKIRLLRERGFRSVFWSELYDYMAGRSALPKNSILLTFDDGYLDNWVYVYPVLKKYGMKGTIFMTTDFVDPRDVLRPNLDDVAAGRCTREELQVAGFLSWSEMREMERSGLIDVQSHAMTHTWYFSGPRVVDYHRPHEITPYPWLFWNAEPSRKPFYLTEDQQKFLPWGYPILEHDKSLVVRRFVPDASAMEPTSEFVRTVGEAFFQRTDWRRSLDELVVQRYGRLELPGEYESEAERVARVTQELATSKALIEKNLDKRVDFVCWPGGGNDPTVQAIAQKVGYKAWTLDSRSQVEKRNRPGADPTNIKRIGTSNTVRFKGRDCGTAGARYQLFRILAHQGSRAHGALVKAYRLAAFARSRLAGPA